ncbi:hypothetical protein NQ317_006554 [Molorchus minor]|uniref:Sphingomyelin phosphodiesterase n=1 Tax=Molorchus minor TaxID=1323400 RepID=A0ABQ9J0A4_9CUCU|nr:hypothetical protein NQ317_006554 [Molorchus minor]
MELPPVKNMQLENGVIIESVTLQKITVDNMLQHIQETHPDIDYIIWTGDLPPHDIWNQTREENLKILKDTVKQMSDMFPGAPIFPALGNHESAPVNRWLLLNSTDPATELQWFIYELQSAEFNGEKSSCHSYTCHIPPGHSDCLKVWSRNYYAIISRYESIISSQFFGHTHFDEFEVFYDRSDLSRAVGIAYVGPSVSPYYNLNPGYRIYYVDGDHDKSTRSVIDHESWTMNLREANLYGYPIWFKLYSARQAFGMDALRPQDWDDFVQRMSNDPKLFELFYKYYYKASPVRPACDMACKKKFYVTFILAGHMTEKTYVKI